MTTITLSFSDPVWLRVREAFCNSYSYQTDVANPNFNPAIPVDPILNPKTIPNTETKEQFVQRMFIQYAKEVAVGYETRLEETRARRIARRKAEDEIIIS